MSAVIACFVKTPGVSPIKTRLGAGIGQRRAEEFYALAVATIRAVLDQVTARVVWAVAESEGMSHSFWNDFDRISQGTGDLGERLSRTYDTLRTQHERVVLIGADSPQVTSVRLGEAISALDETPFALGRCPDGGFYLFAGREPVPEGVWLETPWSSPQTANVFASRLAACGRITELPGMCDVDVASDLKCLAEELAALPQPLPEQLKLLEWLGATGPSL